MTGRYVMYLVELHGETGAFNINGTRRRRHAEMISVLEHG